MTNEFVQKFQPEFDKAIEHFKKELSGLRAGRANPAMVENVLVEAYGVKTPILQVASVSVPEPRCLIVEPWDKNLIKEVEKALNYANLGLSVSAEKTLVRVTVPQMTEENRKAMVKQMNEKLEAAKGALRSIRDAAREEIVTKEKAKKITEDDKFESMKEIDKVTSELTNKLKEITEAKEKEIMSV